MTDDKKKQGIREQPPAQGAQSFIEGEGGSVTCKTEGFKEVKGEKIGQSKSGSGNPGKDRGRIDVGCKEI